jgi:hypothetical protein
MGGYKYIGGRYAHRVIYERHYGSIPSGWIVHHRDEDKSNNDPTNLEAMSRSRHTQIHATGREGSDVQREAACKTLERLRIPKDAQCIHCGAGFVSRSAGDVGKFCSRSCLERWRGTKFVPEQRNCNVCGTEYTAVKRFQRYCCKSCNARSTERTYRTQANGGTARRTVGELPDV